MRFLTSTRGDGWSSTGKTNRVQPNEVDILREQYRPQLAAYWKAVSEMTHLPVEAAIYSTPTGALLRYSEDELETEWERFLG